MDASDMPARPEQTRVLLSRAKNGDQNALNEVLGRYQPFVLSVVRRRLGVRLRAFAESGDVVQETLLQVVKSIQGFQLEDDGAWCRLLAGIVENRIRTLARKTKRLPASGVEGAAASAAVDDGHTVTEQVEEREQRDLLALAMEQLPDHYRECLELRLHGELPFKEIAGALGKTEQATFSLHRRAMEALTLQCDSLRSQGHGG